MAAPSGNKNASKGSAFSGALRAALNKGDRGTLKEIAYQLVEQAANGEAWAIKEVADRLDGKPKQQVTGDTDAPLVMSIKWAND